MKAKLENPLLNYENQWVALDRKNISLVVTGAKTLKSLLKKLKSSDKEKVILMRVPPFDAYYVSNVNKV